MASFFSRFFPKKSASVLGVDIGGSSVKVVQLRRDGGVAVLETYGELALGPYAEKEVGQSVLLTPEKVSENLIDLMREANVTTNQAGIAIPFEKTLLTTISLPRREGKELETMINLEARKYIPVPMSEVQLDYFIIPPRKGEEAKDGRVKVLLVAVHNDALSTLQTVVTNAELDVGFYEIEIFSTIRSVVDEPVKPVMVIDIGASATKVYIVERGLVARAHNIARGGQDVTKALAQSSGLTLNKAESMKKEHGINEVAPRPYNKEAVTLTYSSIFAEARRVEHEFELAEGRPVEHIVLTGGGGVTKHLQQYANEFFKHEVRVGDPFQKVDSPAFMRDILQQIGPEFAVAVGIALRKLEETD